MDHFFCIAGHLYDQSVPIVGDGFSIFIMGLCPFGREFGKVVNNHGTTLAQRERSRTMEKHKK